MLSKRIGILLVLFMVMGGCGLLEEVPVQESIQAKPLPPTVKVTIIELGATQAKLVLRSSEAVAYAVKLDDQVYSPTVTVGADEPYVWPFSMLMPETSYVATVLAKNAQGVAAYEFVAFKTQATVFGAAMFVKVMTKLEPGVTGFVQKTSCTLSAPARVYLYEKSDPHADWALASFTVRKLVTEEFAVGEFGSGITIFYRLVAKNDDDITTDSYEDSFITPPR